MAENHLILLFSLIAGSRIGVLFLFISNPGQIVQTVVLPLRHCAAWCEDNLSLFIKGWGCFACCVVVLLWDVVGKGGKLGGNPLLFPDYPQLSHRNSRNSYIQAHA